MDEWNTGFADNLDLDAVNVSMGREVYFQEGARVFDVEWEQSTEAVTVYYKLPANTHVRSIVCDITAKSLKLGLRGSPSVSLPLTYPA